MSVDVSTEWCAHLLDTHGLTRTPAGVLAGLLRRCPELRVPQGDRLCTEGDPGDDLWFLLEGQVGVRKRDFAGVERHLGEVAAPSVMGHMSLIDGALRTATCVALRPTRLAVLSRGLYDELVDAQTAEGAFLRSLMVACMVEQLHRGMRQLSEAAPVTGEGTPALDDIDRLRLALDGWCGSSRAR